MRINWIIIIVFLFSCKNGPKETVVAPKEQKTENEKIFSTGNLEFPQVPETALDTFTDWKHLMHFFPGEKSFDREALKDKVDMLLNTIRKINVQIYPPRFNNDVIKSRMIRLQTETEQLKWVLDHEYEKPAPDSLFVRMLYAYYHLKEQMKQQVEKTQNFEEIFEAKKKRDEELRKDSLKAHDSLFLRPSQH